MKEELENAIVCSIEIDIAMNELVEKNRKVRTLMSEISDIEARIKHFNNAVNKNLNNSFDDMAVYIK